MVMCRRLLFAIMYYMMIVVIFAPMLMVPLYGAKVPHVWMAVIMMMMSMHRCERWR